MVFMLASLLQIMANATQGIASSMSLHSCSEGCHMTTFVGDTNDTQISWNQIPVIAKSETCGEA